MPSRCVRPTCGETVESLVESLEHLRDRQDVCPGRGQFDRERNALEPAAHFRDEQRVVSCDLEVGPHGARPIDEQLHTFIMREPLEGVAAHERRRRERFYHDLVFARDSEHAPRSDETRETRCRRHERPHDSGRLREQLFEVVEDEKRRPRPELCHDTIERGLVARRRADGIADRIDDPAGVVHIGERYEPDGVVKLRRNLGRGLYREPRLPGSPGTRQGHDSIPLIDEHLRQSRDLVRPAKEPRDLQRQPAACRNARSRNFGIGCGRGRIRLLVHSPLSTPSRCRRRGVDRFRFELREQPASFVARFHVELAPQDPFELRILSNYGRCAPGCRIKRHEVSVRLFAQRIDLNGTARIIDGEIEPLSCRTLGSQCAQQVEHLRGVTIAPRQYPVLVESGQELSAVDLGGVLEILAPVARVGGSCSGSNVFFEGGNVRRESCRIESDRLPVTNHNGPGKDARWFELMSKRGQRLAETVSAGLRFGVRPEHRDEFLARVRPFGVTRKVREQGGRFLRPESRQGHAVGLGGELSKESKGPEAPHRRHCKREGRLSVIAPGSAGNCRSRNLGAPSGSATRRVLPFVMVFGGNGKETHDSGTK